jgi:hypothetical protein
VLARMSPPCWHGYEFAALDEVLPALDRTAQGWDEDEQLRPVAFLVRRAIGDLEIAVEACVGGYARVAPVIQRDLIEVELPLFDFALEPERIDEWLQADYRTRSKRFKPVAVRNRLRESWLHDVVFSDEVALDYSWHNVGAHATWMEGRAAYRAHRRRSDRRRRLARRRVRIRRIA